MEEEYRMQKAQTETQPTTSPVIHEDGSVTLRSDDSTLAAKLADDDASTRGVRSTSGTPVHSPHTSSGANGEGGADKDVDSITNGIPTIRISTESNRERLKQEAEANGVKENGEGFKEAAGLGLEKPVQAAAGEQVAEGNSDEQEAFSFSNKRLCERWLDNLFMVLYEVYSIIFYHQIDLLKTLIRTYASGRSSVRRWRTSRLSMSPIVRRVWNGRS